MPPASEAALIASPVDASYCLRTPKNEVRRRSKHEHRSGDGRLGRCDRVESLVIGQARGLEWSWIGVEHEERRRD